MPTPPSPGRPRPRRLTNLHRAAALCAGLCAGLPGPALLCAPAAAAPAAQAPAAQRLGLREAVELALRSDPGLFSAMATERRGDNALLRAQLDRVSLKVDASLTEQLTANNIGGPTSPDSCAGLVPLSALGGGDLLAPVRLIGQGAQGAVSQAACQSALNGTGVFTPGQGVTSVGVGLFNVSANLQVPLFTGFRITSNVSRARHLRDAATSQVQQERRRAALDVLRSYWAVRRAELQRQVSESAIARYDEALQVVSARVRAGLAPPVDQNRMETRRQREVARLQDLQGAAAEGRAQLLVLLGLPGNAALELTEEAAVPAAPPSDPDAVEGLLSGALRDRPDLRAQHLQTLASKDLIRFQQASYYPQLGAGALLQFGNNPFNPLIGARDANNSANPFTNITGSAFVGATLSINLFDTLNTFTAVRDARYDAERAAQDERRIGRLVEADVRAAHARLLRLYRTREPLQKTRDLAKDTLGIIERRYKNGDALVLEFVDAQLDLLNAEIDLANSSASVAQGWGELQLATGRMPGQQ